MAKQTTPKPIVISNPASCPNFTDYIRAVHTIAEEQTEEAEADLLASWEVLVKKYGRPIALAMYWVWQRTLPRQEWFDVDPDCGCSYLDSEGYLTLDGGEAQYLVVVQ